MNEIFQYDYYRMTGNKYHSKIKNIIKLSFEHRLKYMLLWRRFEKKPTFLTKLRLYRLARKYGLEISTSAKIGKGLYLGHPYNITVASEAELGNNVYVGINAVVVGNIKIGNDVLIAPNTYINCDIPDHSIVFGNPCIVKHADDATKDYINHAV